MNSWVADRHGCNLGQPMNLFMDNRLSLIENLGAMRLIIFLISIFGFNFLGGQNLEQIALYKKLGVKELSMKKLGVKQVSEYDIARDTLKFFNHHTQSQGYYFFNGENRIDSMKSFNAFSGQIHSTIKYEYNTLGKIAKIKSPYSALNFNSERYFRYNEEGKLDSIIEKYIPTENHPNPSLLENQKYKTARNYVYDDRGNLVSIIAFINFFEKGVDSFKEVFWIERNGLVKKSVQFPYHYFTDSGIDSDRVILREVHYYPNGLLKKKVMKFKHLLKKKKIYKRKKQVTKYRYKFNSKK